MKLRPLIVLCIIALALLAGCATVSFKRGAGPGNAKADEDACRATSTSEEAYADCLRAHGWMVSTPGQPAEPEAAPAPAAVPPPAAPTATKPAAAPTTAKPSAATAPPPPAPAPAATSGTTTKPAAPVVAPAPVAAPAAAPAPAPSPAKKLDPLSKVTVSSWWKLGGTNADLDRAVAACVDELGETHRPNGLTEVTVGLRDCLRGKKWFPVGGSGGLGKP